MFANFREAAVYLYFIVVKQMDTYIPLPPKTPNPTAGALPGSVKTPIYSLAENQTPSGSYASMMNNILQNGLKLTG